MSTLLRAYEDEFREQTRALTDEIDGLRATLSSPHTLSPVIHDWHDPHSRTDNSDSNSADTSTDVNSQATSSYHHVTPLVGSGSRGQRVAAIMIMMTQLRKLVTDMEYESNDVPSSLRNSVRDRVASYKTQLRSLEEAMSSLRNEAGAADRKDLMGGSRGAANNALRSGAATASMAGRNRSTEMSPIDADTASYRQSMRENTATMRGASNTLLKSEKLLNDTEQIGSEAFGALRAQTDTMRNIHETTFIVDEEVTRAHQIVRRMRQVMIKHKLILIGIIGVLILLIIVAIYATIAKHRSMAPDKPHYIPVDPADTKCHSTGIGK